MRQLHLKPCLRAFCLALCLALCASAPALADEQDALAAAHPPVLYVGIMIRDMSVRETPNREAKAIATVKTGERIEICGFTPEWLYIVSSHGMGYVLRLQVRDIEALDPESTLPYGVIRHLQIARVATDTAVYTARDADGGAWCNLRAGSRISFWYIEEGWATVPYQRGIGYVPVSALVDLTPVSPTTDYARSGDLISAFTSFYDTRETELNSGRMVNIDVACKLISNVLQPDEQFSFNDVAGPYRRTMGYMPAPVLFEGATIAGYGGGTCQVSTTLYNVMMQLPKGMPVLYRRAHGPSGAKYVPHGMDAAVGTPTQNLVFQNSYPFPVRIDAYAQDGALFIALYKA
jgi:hypothetical protein